MKTATKFKPNEKQQECIDNIEGKYLVLAGPGTGKTYTIIQRIKSMIERKINPEKILLRLNMFLLLHSVIFC